jgi:hypothetical protein
VSRGRVTLAASVVCFSHGNSCPGEVSSMPAPKAGESKQALIITLVFFILLSIVLGVFTYMGYADSDKYLKEKNTAEQNEKRAKDDAVSQRNMTLLYRTYIGMPPADKQELKVAYEDSAKLASKGDKDGNDKSLQELEKSLGWDKVKGLPNTDMIHKMGEYEKKVKELQDVVAQKEEELKKRVDEAKKARDQRDAFEVEAKKELEKQNARADADLKKYNEQIGNQRVYYVDNSKTIEMLKDEIDKKQKEYEKLEKTKKKEIKDLMTQLDKLEEKKPRYDARTFDQPKGKIVLMDKTGSQPFINLGTADRVRKQLTFSIHGLGADGRPLKDSKGSLEIFNIVGEHLSQARITWQADEVHDPVVSGDVLMNTAWDPNQQRHVAISGMVDLTGEGPKERAADALRAVEEFKRSLENQGMIVDAWIDFVDNSVKGKGITRETDYLIMGDLPKTRSGIFREGDTKTKQIDDVVKLATRMDEEATKLGVVKIKLRDFLAMTGYRVPRPKQDDLSKFLKPLSSPFSPIDKTFAKPKVEGESKDKEK